MMYSRIFLAIFGVLWVLWTILQIQFDFPPRYNLRAFNLYSGAVLFIVGFLPGKFVRNFFIKYLTLAVVVFLEIQLIQKCIGNIDRLTHIISSTGVHELLADYILSLAVTVAFGVGLAISAIRLLFAKSYATN